MFHMTKTAALLAGVNVREEKHGKTPVRGVDLTIRFSGSNNLLEMFSPGLTESLFIVDPEDDGTATIGGVSQALRKLRHGPILTDIHPKNEVVGAKVQIEYGVGASNGKTSDIDIDGAHIKAFKVKLKEGGSCDYEFKIGTSFLSDEQFGKLSGKLGLEITVTVYKHQTDLEGKSVTDAKAKPTKKSMANSPFKDDRSGVLDVDARKVDTTDQSTAAPSGKVSDEDQLAQAAAGLAAGKVTITGQGQVDEHHEDLATAEGMPERLPSDEKHIDPDDIDGAAAVDPLDLPDNVADIAAARKGKRDTTKAAVRPKPPKAAATKTADKPVVKKDAGLSTTDKPASVTRKPRARIASPE